MMTKHTTFFLLLLFLIKNSWAETNNLYPLPFVGLKGGYQFAIDDNYKHSAPNSTILGTYGGLHFSEAWSWDIGYQYHDELKAAQTLIIVKTQLVESALRYDWYLHNKLSIYGRLGAAYWNMDKSTQTYQTLDDKGFSPLTELGVNYHITPSTQLSVGYQYINSIGPNEHQYDSHAILLGVSYTFGQVSKTMASYELDVIEDVEIQEKEVTNTPRPLVVYGEHVVRVYFGFDLYTFNKEGMVELNKIGGVLNKYPQAKVEITGHTDSIGTEKYNQVLSENRALVVANYLQSLGVEASRILIKGSGKNSPSASNATKGGRAKNRRVVIRMLSFDYQEQESVK